MHYIRCNIVLSCIRSGSNYNVIGCYYIINPNTNYYLAITQLYVHYCPSIAILFQANVSQGYKLMCVKSVILNEEIYSEQNIYYYLTNKESRNNER